MKILVQVLTSPIGEIAKVKVTTEKGKEHVVVDAVPGGQVFDLEDGERLVIEGKVEEKVVVDRNQNAAIKVPVEDHDGSVTVAKNEAQRLRQGAKDEAARNAPQKNAAEKMAEVAKEALKPPVQPPKKPDPAYQTGVAGLPGRQAVPGAQAAQVAQAAQAAKSPPFSSNDLKGEVKK